jgi:hypothetical protein
MAGHSCPRCGAPLPAPRFEKNDDGTFTATYAVCRCMVQTLRAVIEGEGA